MSLPRSLSRILCSDSRRRRVQETSYDKACSDRRGSAPATPVLGLRAMDASASSRFANFFSKRSFKSNPLKRTKSVTKLERKRCTIDADSVPPSRLRTSRSHESLLQSSPSALATLDLSHGDVQVSALHSSLLGQENCFQMVSNGGTRFYTCRTKEERDRWLYSLKKTIQPNQDSVRRKENSLRIWILEAKGVVAKKSRYYCELCLDKTLYARTSSKQKGDMCFWGEHFEFSSLPCIENIHINLYREADKKKRRDKNVLIGTVHIPVSSINGRHLLEKWYPVTSEKNVTSKDIPSIRIKSRFQTVEILPLVAYKELLLHLKTDFKTLCEMLEPVISVRAKEDIATTLINIMQKENMAKTFLAELVMSDIEKIGDLHLTFRGNSLATKATEAYMKLLGDKYLQETLGMFLKMALDSSDDCEVDPMKVTNNTALQRQQSNLLTYVEMVWVKITNSASSFPCELQDVFHEYRKKLASIGKEELCDNLISASIFLRFLCPAILSPSLFNLSQEYPQGKAARNLTLVAKTIQTLANFTRFGGKESFMEFMNGFVEKEWSTMKSFLKQISSPSSKDFPKKSDFDGYIDLGRELAVLHNLLTESLSKVNQKCYFDQIDKLQHILDCISVALSQSPNTSTKIPLSCLQLKNESKLSCSSINNSQHQTSTKDFVDLHSSKREVVQTFVSNNEIKNNEYEYHLFASLNTSEKESTPMIHSVRSATLPRNAYLMGSSKKAATDLSTSDDYVLYSALESEHYNSSGKEQELNLKNTPLSSKLENNTASQLTKSCIYGEILNNKTATESAIASNTAHIDLKKKVVNEQKSTDTSLKNVVFKNIIGPTSKLLTLDEDTEVLKKKDIYDVQDEDPANSSGEMEVSNAKGSQISIGQLSTVGSSGYQSFPYSQSNSPVDLTYQQDGSSGVTSSVLHPLAFNNPMYHFPVSATFSQCDALHKTQCKHLRLSQMSAFSSLSAEDISILCCSSLGNADSTPVLSVNGCCSSSSGSASCSSTPPAERRNTQFKSLAPRTNPHYSGSQHACRNVCATCSPRLNSRALSHPVRTHCYSQGKQCAYASLFQPKRSKIQNSVVANINSKINLNCMSANELDSNCNIKTLNSKELISSNMALTEDVNKNNKTIEDYECEVLELRKQMIDLQNKLCNAESKLSKQETVTEKVVAQWQARLEAGEEKLRKQQEEKDEQMKNIITRLITVEDELRKEQQEMQGVIVAKQKVIEEQERKIQTLDATNSRLLGALAQLKERYQLQGHNGTSVSSPNSPAKLAIFENGDIRFKSSSC